jgi:hypothetical protein
VLLFLGALLAHQSSRSRGGRLKLYPTDGSAPSPERPVIDDHYDEIVFNTLPEDADARLRLTGEAVAAAAAAAAD